VVVILAHQPRCCGDRTTCIKWQPEFAVAWHSGVAGMCVHAFILPLPFVAHMAVTAVSLVLHMWGMPQPLCAQLMDAAATPGGAWLTRLPQQLSHASAMATLQAVAGAPGVGAAALDPPRCTALIWFLQLALGFALPALFVRKMEQWHRSQFLASPQAALLVARAAAEAGGGKGGSAPASHVLRRGSGSARLTALYLWLLFLSIMWQLCLLLARALA
jgi:hypothetical protein